MKKEKRIWPIVIGAALCVLTLVYSVALQKAGYLTYLNSDMASEVILARQQATSGHIVETDWLYSTEIHTLHMNLLYAFAFLFTDSYFLARVIGNTIGFLLGMGASVYLTRRLGLSWGSSLAAAALLPLSAGTLYASNMTIGGYYIVHLSFAFLGAGLWLSAGERARRRGKGLWLSAAFFLLCALEGLLSVRYVLCFICPMLVTAALEMIFAPKVGDALHDRHARFFGVTMLGFLFCGAGYVLSEVIYPRVFTSGTGSAASFLYNPLDGEAMLSAVMIVFADFLKLLGWRGEVPLFSVAGIVNLCIAATLVLGCMMTVRVYRALQEQDETQRAQKRMMRYAAYAFLVNLFCFVFIKGTYLNRYLILAVLFLIPVLPVVLQREKNVRLTSLFMLVFCVGLGASSLLLLSDTADAERGAVARGQDMMDAADYLQAEGYTHGYGTFWHVRLMEERTQGALMFTGVVPCETEAGAGSDMSLDFIRWLEMDGAADMDVCPGKTFLLLARDEEAQLASWLTLTGAPKLYENATYAAYGFDSSQDFVMAVYEGKATLEKGERTQTGYVLDEGGRLRIPPYYREAGDYALACTVSGAPTGDSVLQVYTGSNFALLAELPLTEGENELAFTLPESDKYFMVILRAGSAAELGVEGFALTKR